MNKRQLIIPAYHFKKYSHNDIIIEEYVNDSLRVIEEDIQHAFDNEKTMAVTEIPTIFDVPGLTNARAQRFVYFHILRSLEQAKYIPRIEICQNRSDVQRVFIHITWITQKDKSMEQYMDKFIMDRQINQQLPIDLQPEPKPTRRRRV